MLPLIIVNINYFFSTFMSLSFKLTLLLHQQVSNVQTKPDQTRPDRIFFFTNKKIVQY